MSLYIDAIAANDARFPRVSGDEPDVRDRAVIEVAFSPRERG